MRRCKARVREDFRKQRERRAREIAQHRKDQAAAAQRHQPDIAAAEQRVVQREQAVTLLETEIQGMASLGPLDYLRRLASLG